MNIKSLVAFILLFSFLSALAAHPEMPEPEVVQINHRVYALLGPLGLPSKANQGYMVNSTVILGNQGLILVDTGSTEEVGRHLARTIAKISAKPVTHVINTHHHGDHVLGNGAFRDAQIISSAQCKRMVEQTGYEWVARMESMIGREFPNTQPVPASVTFDENTMSEQVLEGVRMVLWVPRGSHTAGDMLVYLPDDKILIGGDVLVNKTVPVMMDANIKNWIATLEKVQSFDATVIVPGHGPLMSMADAAKLHGMIHDFYAGVVSGYKQNLTDSEVRKTLDLTEWKRLENFEAMGANISRAYLEAEADNF